MFETLKLFNFDHSFITWVKCLYTNISTCIYNNGWKSETFYPTRSIRKGCPLSSLLFIVVVEILAIKIRSAENITGIEVNLGEIKQLKITQLADDTTLFVNQSTERSEGRCLWYVGGCGAGVNYSMAFKIDIAIQY